MQSKQRHTKYWPSHTDHRFSFSCSWLIPGGNFRRPLYPQHCVFYYFKVCCASPDEYGVHLWCQHRCLKEAARSDVDRHDHDQEDGISGVPNWSCCCWTCLELAETVDPISAPLPSLLLPSSFFVSQSRCLTTSRVVRTATSATGWPC